MSLGHDSAACLVEDGKIVRYIQEERFNKIKVGVNGVLKSIKYCLGEYRPEDMDSIVMSSGAVGSVIPHVQAAFKAKSTEGIPVSMAEEGFQVDKIGQISHHECHAGSSYYTSGLDKALIISIDGIGEDTTIYVAEGIGKQIRPLYMVKQKAIYLRGKDGVFREHRFKRDKTYSLGWFYGMVTEALGWRLACDEGKTMGLAPYGNPSVIPCREMLRPMYDYYPSGYYHNDGRVYYHFAGAYEYKKLAEKYGRENLAASAQMILEERVIRFIRKWLKRTGHENLCTAGGVFLNVKLNQKISEEIPLNSYWPFPLASDAGLPIGAALVEYHKKATTPYVSKRISNIYWGSEYSNAQIEAVLKRNKLAYKPYDVEEIALKLASNKIVGWFQGRMEAGPRALGGRSILMSPLKAENKDIINNSVKFREGFRPFCPSVTAEAASRYFDGGGAYMITACKVLSKDIPAVTHVDGTARPQILRREDNPRYYDLLAKFGTITGHPVLLNTSLNIMGQPIIESPDDAIRCFYGNGLDLLVIGDFVLQKTGEGN